MNTKKDKSVRSWQLKIFWLLWGGYASYYLCRVNFAVAQPLILKEFPDWTMAQIGAIPSIYAIFYAAGQMINGTIGQKYGTRFMMSIAIFIAAITNLLFSQVSSYSSMLIIWAVNGFAQSAGWPLVVQTISDWNTSKRRGAIVGLLSTCYQVGNVLSWLLAGFLCDAYGWRTAFWVPSLILLPMSLAFAFFLRNKPEDAGLAPIRDDYGISNDKGETTITAEITMMEALKLTLSNKLLWILGIGYFCMNSVRYSFMNWSIQYMADFQGRSIKGSAFTAILIPLVGSLGAISAGWASDTIFGKRRAPVCAIMLFGLAVVCAVFVYIPQGNYGFAALMLAFAGFLIYGPDMLMSGAAAIDIGHPRAAGVAAGFTMCLGSSGSIFSGAGIGYLKDIAAGDWSLVFWILSGLSILSALLMTSIWNARPKGAAK